MDTRPLNFMATKSRAMMIWSHGYCSQPLSITSSFHIYIPPSLISRHQIKPYELNCILGICCLLVGVHFSIISILSIKCLEDLLLSSRGETKKDGGVRGPSSIVENWPCKESLFFFFFFCHCYVVSYIRVKTRMESVLEKKSVESW